MNGVGGNLIWLEGRKDMLFRGHEGKPKSTLVTGTGSAHGHICTWGGVVIVWAQCMEMLGGAWHSVRLQ